MSRENALAYVTAHHVMTLATTGADGVWAAAVFYANDGFDLYFLSAASTRHAVHISQNARVAATIQEDYDGWQEIKGIQLEGAVTLLHGPRRDAAIARYDAKYAFLATAPAEIQRALSRVNWYQLRPDILYFIDNSRGFGHRERIF